MLSIVVFVTVCPQAPCPKDIHALIRGTHEGVALSDRGDLTGVIKVRDLHTESYPEFLDGHNIWIGRFQER